MRPLAFMAALGALLSCSGDPPVVMEDPTRRMAVASFVDAVWLPTHREFATAAAALEAEAQAFAADPSDRAAAREAWRVAISKWQRAELMILGPAGAMGEVAGGEDRRDGIYSWPLVNPCRVDQETLETAYETPEGLAAENVNVRGLDAIEYLLFREDDGNACAAVASINAAGAWESARSEIPARRARYAAVAARLVRRDADALVTALEAFRGSLVDTPSELFTGSQAALNAISDALFYLDSETKDMKVAQPAGLMDCAAESCPDARESLWANASLDHIDANLEGFAAVFRGSLASEADAVGIDDLLVNAGAADLATRVHAAIDAARAARAAIPGDIPTALAADAGALVPLYDAIKAITDLLKTEVVTVLDLEFPDRADGDND